MLYGVVQDHLATLLDTARDHSEHGFGYPQFVEREFEKFLACGQLCRVGCGFCSPGARAMLDRRAMCSMVMPARFGEEHRMNYVIGEGSLMFVSPIASTPRVGRSYRLLELDTCPMTVPPSGDEVDVVRRDPVGAGPRA